jgi:ATP/ADP translocase
MHTTESKTKGKAAVDVIGNPLGKSGGSFIQQILIGVFGSLQASTPYLGGILGAIIIAWIRAAQVGVCTMYYKTQLKYFWTYLSFILQL